MADDGLLDKSDLSPSAQPEISERVLELWRECQTELAKHGITDYAMRLELEIWQAMRMAPGVHTLPEEKIRLRYPDAKSRPRRLTLRPALPRRYSLVSHHRSSSSSIQSGNAIDPVELQNLVDNLGQSCQRSSGKHGDTRDPMKLAADGRPSARKRGYTARWEKAARRFLNKHPTCARLGIDPKCKGLAAEVDHIVAHNGDLRLFWDRSNWQGLCKPCHSRKTLAERRAKPVQNRVNLDGLPQDPAHHWNQDGVRVSPPPRAR